jgi:hypothetical protein
VPDILPRRRLLLASATTLPLLLAAAGCRSSDVFTGPDPLAGQPQPAPDVVTLQAVIAAEENMVTLYRTAVSGDSGTARGRQLASLLAQHTQHLTQLRARLIVPAGTATASPAPAARPTATAPAKGSPGKISTGKVSTAQLRTAERASATNLVKRLAAVEPALAQLFASIAACDATHVIALGG